MIDFIAGIIASVVLGAFGRRAAGGALNQWIPLGTKTRVTGDTEVRLLYGATIAAAALLGGAIWWQAALLVPAVWVGTTTGNFNSMAMGHGQYSYAHDFFGMSAHAALSAILPTVVAFAVVFLTPPEYYDWWWMAGFCMLASPLYTIGWIISGKVGKTSFPAGLQGGSELGEAFWGGACALGAFLTYAGPIAWPVVAAAI